MSVIKTLRDHPGNADRLIRPQAMLLVQSDAKILAAHVGHHIEERPVQLSGVVKGQDVRMGQSGGDANFAEEALRLGLLAGHVGPEEFDGDLAAMLEVFGQEHSCHSTTANFFLDPIAGREAFTQ